MRLHLWQRLFVAFAVLSGVVLLGFAFWQQVSFQRGFLTYLDTVTLQRLSPAAIRLSAAYGQHGDWQFLRDDPRQFGELVEPHPTPDAGLRDEPFGDERPPPPLSRDDRPPPNHRLPPHGPPGLMPRLSLFDAGGAIVVGNPLSSNEAATMPIELNGKLIGQLRLASLPQLSDATQLAFARTQANSALVAGTALLIGALLLAFALARWLLAPVRALTAGTRALADGDYAQRIAATRNDELGALARDFNHLAQSLESNRDARRKWGADIAHELRTPLSILRGEIQALQDGVRPLSRQALDSLHAECERLGSLIEDLYQLSLADAGALDYRFELLDLAEMVRDAIAPQRAAFADIGLSIEESLSRILVRGDERRLAQLVDNLLANARRYTDAPGRVCVEVTHRDNEAQLIVEDTPPGVPDAALPLLFDRLYRVETSRARNAGGAGLGLAICRAIVQAHGGSIEAAHSKLGGLRIVVRLPAQNA